MAKRASFHSGGVLLFKNMAINVKYTLNVYFFNNKAEFDRRCAGKWIGGPWRPGNKDATLAKTVTPVSDPDQVLVEIIFF